MVRRAALGAGCALLLGCVGDPTGPTATPQIAFAQRAMQFDAIGDTVPLQVGLSGPVPSGAASELSFSSDDPSVARVTDSGSMVVVGNGRTTVRVVLKPTLSDSMVVEVKQVVRSITGLGQVGLRFVALSDTSRLRPTGRDRNGVGVPSAMFQFATSDSNVALVSEDGLVTAAACRTSIGTTPVRPAIVKRYVAVPFPTALRTLLPSTRAIVESDTPSGITWNVPGTGVPPESRTVV